MLLCACASVSTCLLFQRCVTTDSSFGYLREAPGLTKKGVAGLKVISGKINYSFFQHGFSPDGLTLSSGGLAATLLKTDHSAFCVFSDAFLFFIYQAVVSMKPG